MLLKNDGVLPVAEPPKRIAVIGWHAGTIRSFFGGCTHLSMAEGMKGDIATMAGVTPEGQVKRKDMPRYPDTFVTSEEPFAEDYEALAKSLYPEVRTLYEAIRDAFPKSEVVYAYGYDFIGTEERRFRKALALAKTCDLTVLTLGGKHGTGMTCSMGENVDSASVSLPRLRRSFRKGVRGLPERHRYPSRRTPHLERQRR